MTSDATSEIPRHLRGDRTVEDVRLPAKLRWPLIALLVAIFLFGGETPMWRNPFDIDRAVWASYVPIPVLVAAGLWWSKRLSAVTMFLNTLEIVLIKFALTYAIAMTLWAAFGNPPEAPLPPALRPQVVVARRERAPEPTPWPAQDRGALIGTVRTSGGAPLSGALVFISSGLADIAFPRPTEPHTLHLDEAGFEAPLVVARRWQPLHGRSDNRLLHTVIFDVADRSTRATPVLPTGVPSPLSLTGLRGVVPIRCTVHRKRAHVAVLHHPFNVFTDEDGNYRLDDVPALRVEVTAWADGSQVAAAARARPGTTSTVDLRLSD